MELILPAFIAGLLIFLAPCTLPLIPGYIGFISGVSIKDIQDGHLPVQVRKRIFFNGLVYVLGFSLIFVGLGVIFGLFGNALIDLRYWLTKFGGICIMFFGFYLAGAHKLKIFQVFSRDTRLQITSKLRPGTPLSSFLFGATFAFGWTPCVGPILGTMLLLVSTKGTIAEGALLLSVFSLGLGLPFLAVALGMSHALDYIKKITPFLHAISIIGGLFLIMIGALLVTGYMAVWVNFFYQFISWMSYDRLYTYL